MSDKQKILVGSRKSELAIIQTKHVISLLEQLYNDKTFEIVTMSTLGDKVLDIPLPKIGEKSLFTKELETALSEGNVDFVVHSLKDLPTTLPQGMAIGAVLKREDPRDALVLQKDLQMTDLSQLPKGSTLGTSSTRRAAQLLREHPHLKIEDIRGNLNTRLRKLDELNKYHGIILATAGLTRMGWQKRITKVLETDEMLYAVGQGALAVECRENDDVTLNLLKPLYDPQTALCVIAERTFLKTLGGGCSAPLAVATNITNKSDSEHILTFKGAVWSLNGKEQLDDEVSVILQLSRNKNCSKCPYKNLNNKVDIENCVDLCLNKSKNECDVPIKKQKLGDDAKSLLENDPHGHCPIILPIGADFMGKCPFLEGDLKDGDLSLKSGNIDFSKCPFFKVKQPNTDSSTSKNITVINSTLFCGLVKHSAISTKAFEEAQQLGLTLADKLIKRGASEIMSNAQVQMKNL